MTLFVSLSAGQPENWPMTRANLRALLPEIALPDIPVASAIEAHGFGIFVPEEPPAFDPDTHRISEQPPVRGADGWWHQRWRRVPLTLSEKATRHEEARSQAGQVLREEAQRRITSAYGEASWEDEIALRLRSGSTPDQDNERERLRNVYHGLKTRIETISLTDLRAFDAGADLHWI